MLKYPWFCHELLSVFLQLNILKPEICLWDRSQFSVIQFVSRCFTTSQRTSVYLLSIQMTKHPEKHIMQYKMTLQCCCGCNPRFHPLSADSIVIQHNGCLCADEPTAVWCFQSCALSASFHMSLS